MVGVAVVHGVAHIFIHEWHGELYAAVVNLHGCIQAFLKDILAACDDKERYVCAKRKFVTSRGFGLQLVVAVKLVGSVIHQAIFCRTEFRYVVCIVGIQFRICYIVGKSLAHIPVPGIVFALLVTLSRADNAESVTIGRSAGHKAVGESVPIGVSFSGISRHQVGEGARVIHKYELGLLEQQGYTLLFGKVGLGIGVIEITERVIVTGAAKQVVDGYLRHVLGYYEVHSVVDMQSVTIFLKVALSVALVDFFPEHTGAAHKRHEVSG